MTSMPLGVLSLQPHGADKGNRCMHKAKENGAAVAHGTTIEAKMACNSLEECHWKMYLNRQKILI